MSSVPNYILVRAKETIAQNNKVVVMNKGEEYLIPLGWIEDKLGRNQITIVSEDIRDIWKPYDLSIDINNKKLLIQRTAGIGDLVFISPLIRLIKENNPDTSIGIACMAQYAGILKAVPDIDKIHNVPLPLSVVKNYDYHLSFMYSIESETGTENDENCYDLLLSTITEENIPDDYKKPFLKKITSSKIDYTNLVGIQPFSGVPIRDLPRDLVVNLIKKLNHMGKTVYIIANPTEHKLIDLANLCKDMKVVMPSAFPEAKDVYETCKIIKNCEFIITSDSAFAHIGPGLGIKTISIYGPFSAKSRTKYYNNSWSIDTQPSCRCRQHTMGNCPRGKYPSPCMDINVDLILNIISSF